MQEIDVLTRWRPPNSFLLASADAKSNYVEQVINSRQMPRSYRILLSHSRIVAVENEENVKGQEAKADEMVPEADEPNSVAKHLKNSEQVAVPAYHGKWKMLISNIIHLTRKSGSNRVDSEWNFHIKNYYEASQWIAQNASFAIMLSGITLDQNNLFAES